MCPFWRSCLLVRQTFMHNNLGGTFFTVSKEIKAFPGVTFTMGIIVSYVVYIITRTGLKWWYPERIYS